MFVFIIVKCPTLMNENICDAYESSSFLEKSNVVPLECTYCMISPESCIIVIGNEYSKQFGLNT